MSDRIAIVFDFDETLAHDSTSGFISRLGLEVEQFWRQRVQTMLHEGWDPIPAYLYELLRESQSRPDGERITRERLQAWGREIAFFPGVEDLFDTLSNAAKEDSPDVEVEFYLISSGIGEILRSCTIADRFRDIWACDYAYDESGAIVFPKNIVSFTEKTRFLFQISKGLVGPESRGRASEVNRRIDRGRYRIPMRHMIVVGDGQTDVPMFALAKRFGGVPIGVYDPDRPNRWGDAWDFVRDQRVASLHTANYTPDGDLLKTLRMAVQGIVRSIRTDADAFRR
jgi:phosphoserine phosphatase